jgi:dihydrolipoamide dehydrogenase
MMPEKFPSSLIVIGSGAIGIEFASFYRTMGTKVTVVEIFPQILPAEDSEIAAMPASTSKSRALEFLPRPE